MAKNSDRPTLISNKIGSLVGIDAMDNYVIKSTVTRFKHSVQHLTQVETWESHQLKIMTSTIIIQF